MSRMPTEIAIGSEWNETPPPDQWDGSQPFYLIELLVSKNATKCNDIYTTAPGKLYANVCVCAFDGETKRNEIKSYLILDMESIERLHGKTEQCK